MDTHRSASPSNGSLQALTAKIVSAYLIKNSVATTELPGLIGSVHDAVVRAGVEKESSADALVPPVPIRRTITPDYIISLEDGRHYKSMKFHLAARGLTPEEYRRKWGLPVDYPMVAPNYAKIRSELAKGFGLGRRAATLGKPAKQLRKR